MSKHKQDAQDTRHPMKRRRQLVGTVVSTKMNKSSVVRVDRRFKHKFYKKYVLKSKKYLVHDPEGRCDEGDVVSIIQSKPLSKRKRWALQTIVQKTAEAKQNIQTFEEQES